MQDSFNEFNPRINFVGHNTDSIRKEAFYAGWLAASKHCEDHGFENNLDGVRYCK